MDYKTILTVVILLALPTIVIVISKLILIIRQARRDLASGKIEFGAGESGKRPTTSSDETRGSYEHGVGDSSQVDPGLTTIEVFDYLEESVTCRDPSGDESFEELLTEDDNSDGSDKNSKPASDAEKTKYVD